MARHRITLAIGGAMAAFALLLAFWIISPPRPLSESASPERFAADRAMRDVVAIASTPHPVGSAADDHVAAYLAARLKAMGLRVGRDAAPFTDAQRDRLARHGAPVAAGATANSVIGFWPGRDRRAPALVLMAHHDSVPGSPGAADDAIGVASILEIVRALQTGAPPERSLLVLFTDGEEAGLVGAQHLFARPALGSHAGAVINFEARGGGGRAVMFETGEGNGAMMRRFARSVSGPAATSLAVSVYRKMPNNTDLTAAIRRGVFGFNFAVADRAGLYHSPMATPERLSRGSLQDMGAQGLSLARALLHSPVLPPRTPDEVFDTLLGSTLILYPVAIGWLLLGASLALAIDAARRLARSGAAPGRAALAAWPLPLGLLIGGGLLLTLVNRLSGNDAGANYYDRLAALPRLETQAGLLCLSVLLLFAGWRRLSAWGGWLALFALMAVFGLALQLWLPTAATPIHWPLLIAAVQMAIAARFDPELETPRALLPIGLLAALGTAQAFGTAHALFALVGAGLAPVALAALLPAALLFWPFLGQRIAGRAAAAAAAVLLAGALALACWVRFDPMAPSIPPYSADKR